MVQKPPKVIVETDDSVGVRARSILWYLTFVGFAMNYMIRININIAIIDMIDSNYKSNNGPTTSECVMIANATKATFYQVHENQQSDEPRHVSLEKRILDHFNVSYVIFSIMCEFAIE